MNTERYVNPFAWPKKGEVKTPKFAYLKDIPEGEFTPSDMSKKWHMTHKNILQRLYRLEESGHIVRVANAVAGGKYNTPSVWRKK